MRIAVKDANIIIDLVKLNLLEDILELNFEFHINDLIVNEITDPKQLAVLNKIIEKGQITVNQTEAKDYTNILSLQTRNLSFEDCSIMHYAQQKEAILLSGDGNLRKTARNLGIEVKGILYLIDSIFEEGIINMQTAYNKIILLQNINNRLPRNEIEKRKRAWNPNQNNET